MKPALAPGPAHLGRTAGRSDGPRNRVPPNVPPPVLHVLSPVLAVLSKVTPWLSPACGPCARDLVYMEAPVLCRDSAEFCRAVGPCERALASGLCPARGDRFPRIRGAAAWRNPCRARCGGRMRVVATVEDPGQDETRAHDARRAPTR